MILARETDFRNRTLRTLTYKGKESSYYSLPALENMGFPGISGMPVSLRIILESVLRNCDGDRVNMEHVEALASWQKNASRVSDIPFTVGRIVLNCAAGIPLLGDLTAIRSAVARRGLSSKLVRPAVPVDMALDHTLTLDFSGKPDSMARNMALDIERNSERYGFVKWAMQTYDGIRLFPPGAGILHQLNLEFLAPGLLQKDGVCFPDTLVGTDSHTCMISGLGSVGWGVGGIEAQAALLGRPVYFLTPDVVGVNMTGRLRNGVTATDLVLHVTNMLREANVVGQFVEFIGDAVAHLTVPDRATIANMAPEYGATIGFFPFDHQNIRYLRATGRSIEDIELTEHYYREQGLFGTSGEGIEYTRKIDLDLDKVVPGVAGPKRPQDLMPLDHLKPSFIDALSSPKDNGGYGKDQSDIHLAGENTDLADGSVAIAAITSCTNTSNPGVVLAAGLIAKNAVARGLKSKPWVKTSLTPGSVAVSKYLEELDLQAPLNELGFSVAGFSCATCVGASGPLNEGIEDKIREKDIVACAVLSGNRNFEARIHPALRASYLASPPLVVAFALAGRVDIDFETEPLANDRDGNPVYLKDIWPTPKELAKAQTDAANPEFYLEVYKTNTGSNNSLWDEISTPKGEMFPWDGGSTYIKESPFLDNEYSKTAFSDIVGARTIAILGDSVTTDHISPIGAFAKSSPAGLYLTERGVELAKFNNFGSRRMNHEVMVRGTFSNIRLRNKMMQGKEGGFTVHQPDGEEMTIFDAAMKYASKGTPLIIVAGKEYGTGSARDWAAKGTRMLGVRAVVASSFERIHRSNLIGMGVLPCQFPQGVSAETLKLDGSEKFDIAGLEDACEPNQTVSLTITRVDGTNEHLDLVLRLDTMAEFNYARSGGLMPYLLREIIEGAAAD